MALIFLLWLRLVSRSFGCIWFWVVCLYISPDMSSNTGIQCDLLEAPLRGIQCWFNYPKIGLIRLLFTLLVLTIGKRDQNTGEKRYFIHKLVGKYDVMRQNRKLITPHIYLLLVSSKTRKEKGKLNYNVITPLSQVTRLHWACATSR